MTAAPQPASQESLVAGRNLRVAVAGDGGAMEIVEVKTGEAWPAEALGRVDVLIRTGHVIRFDENGLPDKRSRRYCRRLGIAPPLKYQVRTFEQRARALAQEVEVGGRRIRLYAGRPDGSERELYVANGRAYVLRRGAPDSPGASGASRKPSGGGTTGTSRRRRSGAGSPKRRRKKG